MFKEIFSAKSRKLAVEELSDPEEATSLASEATPMSRDEGVDVEMATVSITPPEADGEAEESPGLTAPEKRRWNVETAFPVEWSGNFECLGELIIERLANPAEVIQVYRTLKDALDAEIFYVYPTQNGTSMVCGVRDASSFLSSLPAMPRVASWALTHR